ncbi:MAG: YigZ family protein [Lachnospiraceae bacterium]|nr:YigZ family protein [Lachnospiraceae bacterium]
MEEAYRTIEKDRIYTGEYTEKKSRFIGELIYAETEERVKEYIASVKKKHYDARHHCSAYILRGKAGSPEVLHSSDDGEPSGTAGKPMLDVLTGTGLKNVCLTVTRYFGGTLLGTGGLVRAYSAAANEAVKNAVLVDMQSGIILTVDFDYSSEGKVRRMAQDNKIAIRNTEYTDKVKFSLLVPTGRIEEIEKTVTNELHGNVKFERSEVEFFPFYVL